MFPTKGPSLNSFPVLEGAAAAPFTADEMVLIFFVVFVLPD